MTTLSKISDFLVASQYFAESEKSSDVLVYLIKMAIEELQRLRALQTSKDAANSRPILSSKT